MECKIMRELNVIEVQEVSGGVNWFIGGLAYDAVKWFASQSNWGTAKYADMMVAP